MKRIETAFGAADNLTPQFAARVADMTSGFRSEILLACGQRRLRMDSLISILALDLRRGTKIAVIAEGEDEEEACAAVAALFAGDPRS